MSNATTPPPPPSGPGSPRDVPPAPGSFPIDPSTLPKPIRDELQAPDPVAIDTADLIVFVVDAQTGLTPADRDVAARLRKVATPRLLVVNKCDTPKLEDEIAEFYALADAAVVTTSVKARRNRDALLQAIVANLPPEEETEQSEGAGLLAVPELKLAIVGRALSGMRRATPPFGAV